MKGKIFCIIGKSCSGKDTIFKRLKEDSELDLKPIVTYTTRPRRKGEEDGVDYHFVSELELQNYSFYNKVIECRQYKIAKADPYCLGIWSYFTVDDGNVDLRHSNYICVCVPKQFDKLAAFYGSNVVVPLYIQVDDGIRLMRAMKREGAQAHPNYAELCRRYLTDEEDFCKDKLRQYGVSLKYTFINNDENLERCIEPMKGLIRYLTKQPGGVTFEYKKEKET